MLRRPTDSSQGFDRFVFRYRAAFLTNLTLGGSGCFVKILILNGLICKLLILN